MKTPLLIVGAGGFCLEAIWLADLMNHAGTARWEIVGLADEHLPAGESMGGYTVLGTPEAAVASLSAETAFHVAIGDNRTRLRLALSMEALGLRPASLVSPRAEIAISADIEPGCFISHFASVAPQARLGAHAIVNVSAVVGHEAVVGAGAQLCPGAVATGRCRLGEGAFLGGGAVLHPGVRVGDWARVSANTFASADVEPGVTLATMPGRPVFTRRKGEEK